MSDFNAIPSDTSLALMPISKDDEDASRDELAEGLRVVVKASRQCDSTNRPMTPLLRDSQLDSLPYLDDEKEMAAQRENVDRIVAEEASNGPHPLQYYMDMVPPEAPSLTTKQSELFLQIDQFKRLKHPCGELDYARYSQIPPSPSDSEQRKRSSMWESVLRNIDIQIEHADSTMTNHELLTRYGPSTWKVSNRDLEIALQRLDNNLQVIKKQTASINRKRKTEQLQIAKTLGKLQREYDRTILKNTAIFRALRELTPDS